MSTRCGQVSWCIDRTYGPGIVLNARKRKPDFWLCLDDIFLRPKAGYNIPKLTLVELLGFMHGICSGGWSLPIL